MSETRNLVVIPVEVNLMTSADGGRATSVKSGFRPLCYFDELTSQPVGLCELELLGVERLEPGGSSHALLKFDAVHRGLLRNLAKPGASIALGEGPRIVGRAVVREGPA